MARSAQRRTRQRGERRPTPRASAPAARKPTPTYEDTMFFPRLRRQAKWMFVFLALVFGLGYVIFNVGGTIRASVSATCSPISGRTRPGGVSEGDARDKIKDHPNDPTGYYDLATALQRNGKNEEAIAPLERYLELKPRDRAALGMLAGLHPVRRGGPRKTPRARSSSSPRSRAATSRAGLQQPVRSRVRPGQGHAAARRGLEPAPEPSYVSAQESYRGAADAYKKLINVLPDAEEIEQPSIFLQLAFAAQSANDLEQRSPLTGVTSWSHRTRRMRKASSSDRQVEAAQKAQAAAQTSQR